MLRTVRVLLMIKLAITELNRGEFLRFQIAKNFSKSLKHI